MVDVVAAEVEVALCRHLVFQLAVDVDACLAGGLVPYAHHVVVFACLGLHAAGGPLVAAHVGQEGNLVLALLGVGLLADEEARAALLVG